MKYFVLIVMIVGVCMVSTGATREATEQKTFEETVSFEAGGRLMLQNENGNVEVRSWDRDEVKIWARIKARARDYDEAEELLEEVEIRVEKSGNRLEIYTDRPRGSWRRNWSVSVEYELTVPEKIDLDLGSVNGHISVDTITGDLRLETTNGGIDTRRVHGSVQASTTNGGIEVELLTYDGRDDLRFSTTNGSIEVILPGDLKASLEARTTNGHIETDFPITVQGRFSQKSIRGELNGGGPTQITLRTTNGSIRLREAI